LGDLYAATSSPAHCRVSDRRGGRIKRRANFTEHYGFVDRRRDAGQFNKPAA